MARVWIVNPFDPPPGSPEPPGRYATLARMLRDAGHEVTWWTAAFSHRFKRPVDREAVERACRDEGIGVRLIAVPAYRRNVSVRRLVSHHVFARRLAREAPAAPCPDVVIASNPPPESPAAVARIARRCDARLVIDVQDIWIDNFRQLMPPVARWAAGALLRPWVRANRRGFAAADAVVGVAEGYADEPRRYGRTEYRRVVIPIGIDLASFDASARRGRCPLGEKPAREIWTIYGGGFSRAYDLLTVAQAAVRVAPRRPDVRFIFAGQGDLEAPLRDITRGIGQVTFLGFAIDDWAATVSRCDIGWNAIWPSLSPRHFSPIGLFPNKIFAYWAAGLAVLNTVPGECAEWVHRTGTGLYYPAGDVAAAEGALMQLVSEPARLGAMKQASRRSAVERWDRRVLYRGFLDLVADLSRPGGRYLRAHP